MGEPLYCVCHGRDEPRSAKMAIQNDGEITIRFKQFGETHTLVIDIEKKYNEWQEQKRRKRLERQGAPE